MSESLRDRARTTWSRWRWRAKVVRAAGMPDYRIRAGETLPLEPKLKAIRIAPARLGEPVASFWLFKCQGDEIYAAGRTYMGVFKLSFHRSGKSYATLRGVTKEFAPWKMLDGGRWLQAMRLRYLIGDTMMRPLPEKAFKETAYTIECPPGQYLIAHLLIGADGTTLETPLPTGYGFPKLLQMRLRGGRVAILVGGPIPLTAEPAHAMAVARAHRIVRRRPADPTGDSVEMFSTETTQHGINQATVVPLGPESITTKPPPPGVPRVPIDWFTG